MNHATRAMLTRAVDTLKMVSLVTPLLPRPYRSTATRASTQLLAAVAESVAYAVLAVPNPKPIAAPDLATNLAIQQHRAFLTACHRELARLLATCDLGQLDRIAFAMRAYREVNPSSRDAAPSSTGPTNAFDKLCAQKMTQLTAQAPNLADHPVPQNLTPGDYRSRKSPLLHNLGNSVRNSSWQPLLMQIARPADAQTWSAALDLMVDSAQGRAFGSVVKPRANQSYANPISRV